MRLVLWPQSWLVIRSGESKWALCAQRASQIAVLLCSGMLPVSTAHAEALQSHRPKVVIIKHESLRSEVTTAIQLFSSALFRSDEILFLSQPNPSALSYESVNVKLSYKVLSLLRLYSVGGLLFGQEPSYISPGVARFGLDLDSPWIFLGDRVAPQVSTEFKMHQEYEWNSDFSLRAGFHFSGARNANLPPFTFMAEYFKGYSAHGQLYKSEVEYLGVGLHCKF